MTNRGKTMEFFKNKTNIDFMGLRKWTALLSMLLFAASILSLIVNGLNWGLDFTGGDQVQLHYQSPADLSKVRAQLDQSGLSKAVVQSYGTSQDVLVTLPPEKNRSQQQLTAKILSALP